MTIAVIAFILFIFSAKPASAYIDPGTGSIMLQIIIGSLLAAFFIIKSSWQSLTLLIKRVVGRFHHEKFKVSQEQN